MPSVGHQFTGPESDEYIFVEGGDDQTLYRLEPDFFQEYMLAPCDGANAGDEPHEVRIAFVQPMRIVSRAELCSHGARVGHSTDRRGDLVADLADPAEVVDRVARLRSELRQLIAQPVELVLGKHQRT